MAHGQVAQDMPETDQSATDFVVEGDTALLAAQQEVHEAEASDDGDRMAHAYMALHDAGAHDAQARAQALILGLGFKTTELDNPVNSFSGRLAHAPATGPRADVPVDLLLLDEPTNHLDLDALVWLEAWLKRYEGTMVVISHDREFLDAITNVTLHIDAAKLTRYGGNYSKFEDMRAEQMELQQNAFSKQQDKIAHLQKFIAASRPRPARPSRRRAGSRRWTAWRRWRRCWPSAEFTFEFKEPANLPNPMLAMQGVSFGYPPPKDAPAGTPPTVIVRNVNKSVLAGQRIGILGANGQGKSTLVKTVARDLAPSAATVTEGKGLNIGYFAQQELDVLRPADNPLEHMIRWPSDRAAGKIAGQATREQDLRSFPGHLQFQRRHGQAGRGHHERRRKGPPGAVHDRLAAPQPAAAGRADQPPGSGHARGAGHGAQRVRGHGDAGQPRPRAAALGVRRVLAGVTRRRRTLRRRPGRLPALPAGRSPSARR
jgi:ATP-binding cassette subfamily F protein 3